MVSICSLSVYLYVFIYWSKRTCHVLHNLFCYVQHELWDRSCRSAINFSISVAGDHTGLYKLSLNKIILEKIIFCFKINTFHYCFWWRVWMRSMTNYYDFSDLQTTKINPLVLWYHNVLTLRVRALFRWKKWSVHWFLSFALQHNHI